MLSWRKAGKRCHRKIAHFTLLAPVLLAIFLQGAIAGEAGGPVVIKGHRGHIVTVTLSNDGRRAASCSRDGTIKLWDANSGLEIHSLRAPDQQARGTWPWIVAIAPYGNGIVSAGPALRRELEPELFRGGAYEFVGTTVDIWDARREQLNRSFRDEGNSPQGLAYSRDGSRIALSNARLEVKVWDVTKGNVVVSISGPPGEMGGEENTWRFDGDLTRFVAVTRSETLLPNERADPPLERPSKLILCDLITRKVRTIVDKDGRGFGLPAVSIDGRTIAAVLSRKPGQGCELQFLGSETNDILKSFELEQTFFPSYLRFIRDDRVLMLSDDGELMLADRALGTMSLRLPSKIGRVRALTVLDDRRAKIVVGGDGLTDERDPVTNNLLPTPMLIYDIALPSLNP